MGPLFYPSQTGDPAQVPVSCGVKTRPVRVSDSRRCNLSVVPTSVRFPAVETCFDDVWVCLGQRELHHGFSTDFVGYFSFRDVGPCVTRAPVSKMVLVEKPW